ncbi:MAG: hypothetical protein Q9M31_08535 [Mariprofundus sp.]|nr:hypothetical protein [Mariprofundus sp.]
MQTICYDIISLHRKNLVLNECPHCHETLLLHEVDHSTASLAFCQQAALPEVFTEAFQCPGCGWWAVRELCSDNDLYHPPVQEFIVMRDDHCKAPLRRDEPDQWDDILNDHSLWEHPEVIPSKQAVFLFGTKQLLLPKLAAISKDGLLDRVKGMAPILFPLIVILLIALLF